MDNPRGPPAPELQRVCRGFSLFTAPPSVWLLKVKGDGLPCPLQARGKWQEFTPVAAAAAVTGIYLYSPTAQRLVDSRFSAARDPIGKKNLLVT
jgi:hypothetical protein